MSARLAVSSMDFINEVLATRFADNRPTCSILPSADGHGVELWSGGKPIKPFADNVDAGFWATENGFKII